MARCIGFPGLRGEVSRCDVVKSGVGTVSAHIHNAKRGSHCGTWAGWFTCLPQFAVALLIGFSAPPAACGPTGVKETAVTSGTVSVATLSPEQCDPSLADELTVFHETVAPRGVRFEPGGLPVLVEIAPLQLSVRASRYRAEIAAQGYELDISTTCVTVRGATDAAVFNGLMTLARMIGPDLEMPAARIRDWPDLPVRMIMVDPARQNENFDYYRRVISTAARYGINAVLVHLTDDQTACLYQPDYPELMHPHAWTRDDIRGLVEFARRYHVDLIPEIESFGHSRMFTRRADFREILHQNRGTTNTESWMGTDEAGYTNVLCPASEKAYEYLDKMYEAAAAAFDHPVIHLGFDEVDMTSCTRCEMAFPGITRDEWFRRHMVRCREIAAKHGRQAAFWGDMLIQSPAILDGLPTSGTTIYDWHYLPAVPSAPARMFSGRGFEVIASPALVCAPHMVLPDSHDYENIRNFAAIASELDLRGLNTTIWIPTRYMSDALWPGIAYAGAQAWGGSVLDEEQFAIAAARDLFGIADGAAFARAWAGLAAVAGHRDEFFLCAWSDDVGLKKAREASLGTRAALAEKRASLAEIRRSLSELGGGVSWNRTEWRCIERTAGIFDYLLRHFEAASDADFPSSGTLAELDRGCVAIIGWIEEDWQRNRYADDPNLAGIYLPHHHLLHQFRLMNRFHEVLLNRPK